MENGVVEELTPQQFCTECGRPYAVGDLVKFGDSTVCADCKPTFVQRMREGTGGTIGAVLYGGFWRRWAAWVADSFILLAMLAPLLIVMEGATFAFLIGNTGSQPAGVPPHLLLFVAILMLLVFAMGLLALGYSVYFTKNGGSTPGKMVFGLKVVTALGSPMSTGRSIGRFFASQLSRIIFYIGDIMAGFDSEKRALHDRICDTRVIRIDPPVFGRRIAAFFLDTLLMTILTYMVLAVWSVTHSQFHLITPVTPGTSPDAVFAEMWPRLLQTWAQSLKPTAIALVFQLLYSVYFTSQKGATPGKMVMGVKVVTSTGGPISVGRALGRFLSTYFLSQLLTLGIGFTIAAFDRKQWRALEDRICNTRVVRALESPEPLSLQ